MSNFANVTDRIQMLQMAVQQIQDDALRAEVQAYVSEIKAEIDQIKNDESSNTGNDAMVRKVSKVVAFIDLLDRLMDLWM